MVMEDESDELESSGLKVSLKESMIDAANRLATNEAKQGAGRVIVDIRVRALYGGKWASARRVRASLKA